MSDFFLFVIYSFFIFFNSADFIPLEFILQLFYIPHLHLQDDVSALPPHQTTLIPVSPSLLRDRFIFSDWVQAQSSSPVYVVGALYQLIYAAWLVAQCLRIPRGPG